MKKTKQDTTAHSYRVNKEEHDSWQNTVNELREGGKKGSDAYKKAQREMKRANDRARYYQKKIKKEGAQHWERNTTKVPLKWRQPIFNKNDKIPDYVIKQMESETKKWTEELKDKIAEASILFPNVKNIRANKLIAKIENGKIKGGVYQIWRALRETNVEEGSNAFSAEAIEERLNHEVEAFHDSGYDWVTRDNLNIVKQFFEWVKGRQDYIKSDEVLDFIHEELNQNKSIEDMFNDWVREHEGGDG